MEACDELVKAGWLGKLSTGTFKRWRPAYFELSWKSISWCKEPPERQGKNGKTLILTAQSTVQTVPEHPDQLTVLTPAGREPIKLMMQARNGRAEAAEWRGAGDPAYSSSEGTKRSHWRPSAGY